MNCQRLQFLRLVLFFLLVVSFGLVFDLLLACPSIVFILRVSCCTVSCACFCLGFHAELCPLWLLPLFSVFVLAFPTSLRLLGSDALGM